MAFQLALAYRADLALVSHWLRCHDPWHESLAIICAVSILGLGALTACSPSAAQPSTAPSSAATKSWDVAVGTQSEDLGVQIVQFFPDTINVNVGDSITWTNATAEIHTITLLAPGQDRPDFDRSDPLQEGIQGNGELDGRGYINSGVLEAGKTFTVTATQPGTYDYICLVHRQQLGHVLVSSAGTAPPQSQADAAASVHAVDSKIADWQTRARMYEPRTMIHDDGAVEQIVSGGMGDGVVAVMRFTPQTLDVHVGDTVTWENADVETPHTITFGQPQGPPIRPWGDPEAYDGTRPLNSGYFGKNWPPGSAFSVTFTAPGQFRYACLLHIGEGMSGIVNVLEI